MTNYRAERDAQVGMSELAQTFYFWGQMGRGIEFDTSNAEDKVALDALRTTNTYKTKTINELPSATSADLTVGFATPAEASQAVKETEEIPGVSKST